jgi:hypothetical protein
MSENLVSLPRKNFLKIFSLNFHEKLELKTCLTLIESTFKGTLRKSSKKILKDRLLILKKEFKIRFKASGKNFEVFIASHGNSPPNGTEHTWAEELFYIPREYFKNLPKNEEIEAASYFEDKLREEFKKSLKKIVEMKNDEKLH